MLTSHRRPTSLACVLAVVAVALSAGTVTAHASWRPIVPDPFTAAFSTSLHVAPASSNGAGRTDTTDVRMTVTDLRAAFNDYEQGAGSAHGMIAAPGSPKASAHLSWQRSTTYAVDQAAAGDPAVTPDPTCPRGFQEHLTGEASASLRLLSRNRAPRPGQARFGFPSEPSLVPKVVQHTRLAYTVRERAFTIEIGLRIPVRHDATFVERAVDQQTGESTGTCTTRTGATNSVADVDVSIPARIAADGRTVRFGIAQATISGEDRLSVQGFEPRAIDDTITGPATGTGRFAHAVTTPCPAGSPRNIGGHLRCRG